MSQDQYDHLLKYLDQRFEAIDKRFDGLENRVGRLEVIVDGLAKQILTFGQELTILIHRVDRLEAK